MLSGFRFFFSFLSSFFFHFIFICFPNLTWLFDFFFLSHFFCVCESRIAMEYCFGVDDKSEEDKSIRAIVKKKYLALKQSSGL